MGTPSWSGRKAAETLGNKIPTNLRFEGMKEVMGAGRGQLEQWGQGAELQRTGRKQGAQHARPEVKGSGVPSQNGRRPVCFQHRFEECEA